jgi:hypothetical protein
MVANELANNLSTFVKSSDLWKLVCLNEHTASGFPSFCSYEM